MYVFFKKLNNSAKIPTKGSPFAAGYDLYSSENTIIEPGQTSIVKIGLASEFSLGYVALIWDRSGMGVKGMHRFAGVIDCDYRGEWGVVLHNTKKEPFVITIGDRIAQVLFQTVECAN